MNFRNGVIATSVCVVMVTAALAQNGRTERQYFQIAAMKELNLPFSDAVLAGDTLYLSGNGGLDVSTMTAPEDPKEEARLLMENFQQTLALADMTLDNLVSVTIYCPDLSLYADFNEVYQSYFEGDFPARAFIGSGPLLFGMRFEMQAIAVR